MAANAIALLFTVVFARVLGSDGYGSLVALLVGSLAAVALWLVPMPMFPSGIYTETDRLIVLAIPALALTEILLAAQAYRYDIAATVRARAIVEP